MKKIFGLLAVVLLVMACVPMVTVHADEPTGQWVLDSVEDTTQEDYYSSDSESGDGWFIEDEAATKFQYERSNFAVNWYTEVRTEEGTQRGEGTMHTSFSLLHESFKASEQQGFTVDLASTFLQINTDGTGFNPDAVATATIACSQYLFEGGNANEIVYDIPLYPSSDYALSEAVTFTAPAAGDTLTFDFTFSVPYVGTLGTSYTYKWVGSETKQNREIDLKGVVLSAEAKPMPWMKLSASVFYGTDAYSGAQPDEVIEGATDHQGRYSLHIPIPEDSEGPVGILVKGTLTCVYPYDGDKDVFYFVDMQNTLSKDTDEISLATWFTVNPEDAPETDVPISVYRLLAFYNLGLDAWSFDFGLDTAGPDPLYLYSQDTDEQALLQNYSTLYTAAFDAWFLGAAVLGEQESLAEENIRIELRWPVTEELNCSHFSPADMCVRLEDTDSKRDDNSRFTILHELGHVFDYNTNGNVYRAYAPHGEGNVNHGGYLNDSTSDSYIEGFATFFAGTVQLYSGYPNPNVLSWIDLGRPDQYSIWEVDGRYEELAIASLLYQTHFLIDDVAAYWELLDTNRANFYAYYQAMDEYLMQHNADGEKALEDLAYTTGLFKMPFGNNAYDAGEPYQDLNENGVWDSGEPFGDLMYDTNADGSIDITTTLQAFDRTDLVMGQASDALRDRDIVNTIQPAENSYIYLSGEPVDYVLVDILPDGEAGTRVLMGAADGRVLIGLPASGQTGKVMVSIPGGGTIFEGDLAELQQRFSDTTGQAVPLAEATVSADDLAPEGTQAAATYGSTEASGVFTAPEISQQELIQFADGYDGGASIEQVIAELSGRVPIDFAQPEDEDSGVVADFPSEKTGGRLVYIIIGIVLALGAGALVIVVVLLHVRSRKRSPISVAAPYNGPRYCTRCGYSVPPGNAFCAACGTPQPVAASALGQYGHPPKRSPALLIIGIVAAILMLGGSIYLLFFVGQRPTNTEVMGMPAITNEAWTETTQKPAAAVDYAATRDAADLIGVWAGTLEYTEISGNWETFTYPVSEGYSQPFMLKITEGSPEYNWRQAILRIDGGDAAVLSAGFEGRFLEIRGEWQSCDVRISVEYDEARGGFAGIGEYIHSDKHASFDFFVALADENTWDNADAPAATASKPSPTQAAEMVSAQTITVSMAYDSGEGIYTGEVKDGVPHGQGSFEMLSSDNGNSWSYEGRWENGEITGEGTMWEGSFIFTGSFKGGLLNGSCEITDNGILRYKGMCQNGKLHGQGTLYTKSGMLLFEGMFDNDMLVESASNRQARGAAFMHECNDMDALLYAACLDGYDTLGYPTAVWGFPLAMGEQTANGTIVIGHMGEDSYPVCLVYRYGVDEAKMTGDDWIKAWGVVAGTYEYVDEDGLTVTCPMIEAVYWDNEQEGL